MPTIRINILRYSVLLCCMSFANSSYGQALYQFRGKVVDENNEALIGATVTVATTDAGAITDLNGVFLVENLSKRKYKVEISFVGYETKVEVVYLENQSHHFQLEKSATALSDVVVMDNYADFRKKEASLNTEIVSGKFLKENLGGSLMKSLAKLPGVSTIDIGTGQSKPVIRGLGFNRVVVVENNIKHEAQQWGADHGLEIDQYAVDNVEIIKGPASLMYGSDAIGGIIDMKNRSVPTENSFGGVVDLSGKTNNDFVGTSVSLFARKKQFFATARATLLDYGDYKVPTDSVEMYSYRAALHNNNMRNTAGKEQNFHSSFGLLRSQFHSKFFISNIRMESGFFANAYGLEPRRVDTLLHDSSNRDIQYPFQKSNHFKAINRTSYWWNKASLELDLGYQHNLREERSQYVDHGFMPSIFPETTSFKSDLDRQFDKVIYSGNAKLFYQLSDKTQLNTGINSEYSENRIDGRGFIIPAYEQFKIGGFLFGKHKLSKQSLIQAGMRYDYGTIRTASHYDWFLSPVDDQEDPEQDYLQRALAINRDFSNFTWSVGYNYSPAKWSYKVNVGKSFRMPIAKELAANGVNYHRFSFEVGDVDLSPEISYQLDIGAEYSSKKLAFGVSPFINYFSNYIYLNPTADFDRLYGNGNQIFEYTESEVFRYGGELQANYFLTRHIQMGISGEYVYALQMSGEKEGFTLPFAPPASAIFNLKYQHPHIAFIHDAYLSLDYRVTAAQNSIVPPEEPTDGFQVLNLGFGGALALKKQKINISMQVQNLLNNKYFNHTSYYRLINVPEPARNFIINLSIPFAGKMK